MTSSRNRLVVIALAAGLTMVTLSACGSPSACEPDQLPQRFEEAWQANQAAIEAADPDRFVLGDGGWLLASRKSEVTGLATDLAYGKITEQEFDAQVDSWLAEDTAARDAALAQQKATQAALNELTAEFAGTCGSDAVSDAVFDPLLEPQAN